MIVVDTSVFIDMIFRFNEKRHKLTSKLFWLLQDLGITIIEPEVFKIEVIGCLVRKMNKEEAILLYEEIIKRIEIVETENLKEMAFLIAFETGCRAIDSFFIAAAKIRNSFLVTNDKIMANNAKNIGVEAYYLIDEFDKAIKRIKKLQRL